MVIGAHSIEETVPPNCCSHFCGQRNVFEVNRLEESSSSTSSMAKDSELPAKNRRQIVALIAAAVADP